MSHSIKIIDLFSKRIINLTSRGPGGPVAGTTVPGIRGRFRVTCGHCNEIFVVSIFQKSFSNLQNRFADYLHCNIPPLHGQIQEDPWSDPGRVKRG